VVVPETGKTKTTAVTWTSTRFGVGLKVYLVVTKQKKKLIEGDENMWKWTARRPDNADPDVYGKINAELTYTMGRPGGKRRPHGEGGGTTPVYPERKRKERVSTKK